MNSLSCEESPKITKLNNRNRISFLVLAERIDMIFRAPFDDFLVWTSGFFGIFKSCCQKYSRLRCFLRAKGLVICFYLGWSGSILQFRQNTIKVGSKSWLLTCRSNITLSLPSLESVQDFLIKLDMKPCMHLVETSIFAQILSWSDLPILWTEPTKIGHNFIK